MPSFQPLSVAVHANQLDAVDQLCASTLRCAGVRAPETLLLLAVTGLLTLVVIVAAAHVREARATVTEERSRTATERRAFTRFSREVAGLEATGPAARIGHNPGAVATVSASIAPSKRGLEPVRTAYEETVLAMDHYVEEYDEPLAEHMGRELGEELATAVEQSQQLTPPLQRALVERSRGAARDRERLMSRLDHECDALEAADDELTAVADTVDEAAARSLAGWSFSRLADEWNRLGELESRLSRLLSGRQETLQDGHVIGPSDDQPSLNAYLYDGLETTYPVLADASALADRVKDVRRRVLVELTRRV